LLCGQNVEKIVMLLLVDTGGSLSHT